MGNEIRAIETHYKGYKFRSRLEARWAVFFDASNIKYQYEPEGFKGACNQYYLPDFYLPDYDIYAEVKGTDDRLHSDSDSKKYFIQSNIKQRQYLLQG